MNIKLYIKRLIPSLNKVKVDKQSCFNNFASMSKTSVNIFGENNSIVFGKGSVINNCKIYVNGNNNSLIIGNKCFLNNCLLWIEEDNNLISIGDNVTITDSCDLSVIEGTELKIGKNCLFAKNISIRTGDGHSLTDLDGKRLNVSKSVHLGEHIWIGQNVVILKGVEIADNTVIGVGSVVTKSVEKSNTAIAGNPAIVIKENISWDYNRI